MSSVKERYLFIICSQNIKLPTYYIMHCLLVLAIDNMLAKYNTPRNTADLILKRLQFLINIGPQVVIF